MLPKYFLNFQMSYIQLIGAQFSRHFRGETGVDNCHIQFTNRQTAAHTLRPGKLLFGSRRQMAGWRERYERLPNIHTNR